jgi:hypothetical protein
MAVENWQQPAIGAGAAFLGSIPQMVEARRLRKERERLLQEGAPGLTPIEQEQMAAARARAASTLAPGYAQEMEGIAQQQADVLAAGKRGSATGSNLLNLLSRMNAQGQAARRNLAMRGAQAQRSAQSELSGLSMNADARRENRMRRYEDDLSAMDAARRQYNAAAAMAPLQGAIAFMPYQGMKFTKNQKPDITIPSEGTPMTYGENLEYQSQYNRPSATDNVPRNLPYAPSNLRTAPTGLEREPSMMAAPYTGETEKEFLIRNPVYNTAIRSQYVKALPSNMLIQSPIRQPYYNFGQ